MGLDKSEVQRRRAALEQRQLAERNQFMADYMPAGIPKEIGWGAPSDPIVLPIFQERKCQLFNTTKSLRLDMTTDNQCTQAINQMICGNDCQDKPNPTPLPIKLWEDSPISTPLPNGINLFENSSGDLAGAASGLVNGESSVGTASVDAAIVDAEFNNPSLAGTSGKVISEPNFPTKSRK